MKLSINSITLDSDLQPRVTLDQGTINEYAEAMKEGTQFPDVVVFHDGATYWLADGYHRYAAAKKAGVETIGAEIRTGSKEDALKFALSANVTHGLRRSQADKRRAVIIALKRFGDLSNRELGRMTAVDDKTVGKYRERLATSEDVIRRLETGESFVTVDEDHKLLYLFRMPDHARFEGRKFIKRIRIDKDDMVHWDTRGINIDLLKRHDSRILDLTEFSNWQGMTPDEAIAEFAELVEKLELDTWCGPLELET